MFKIELVDGRWVLTINGETVAECATKHEAVGRLVAHPAYSETLAATTDLADEDSTTDDAGGANLAERWTAGPDGVALKAETGPERDFSDCTYSWRELPLPLMLQTENKGHYEAVWCGTIDTASGRQDGGVDMGGTLLNTDEGRMARQLMEAQGSVGVSVDPSEYVTAEFECTDWDEEWGYCNAGVWRFTEYEIAGLTIVPFPGFETASITLEGAGVAAAASLTAATPADRDALFAPVKATRAWFEMPEPALDSDTAHLLVRQPPRWAGDTDVRYAVPLTITDEGQVFGHVAGDGTCHIGFAGECVTVPPSPSAYARYHLHAYETAEGDTIAVGPLIAGCDHAVARMRAAEARDYYAHNGLAWADVRAIDGQHGPWVCGSLRNDVTVAQAQIIRASGLSGDWRDHGGGLDMIAAQLVNTEGFPIIREAMAAAATAAAPEGNAAIIPAAASFAYATSRGRVTSLVAAGIVHRDPETADALAAAAGCGECAKRAGLRRAEQRSPRTFNPAVVTWSAATTMGTSFYTEESFKRMLTVLERIDGRLSAVEVRTRHLRAAEATAVATQVADLVSLNGT